MNKFNLNIPRMGYFILVKRLKGDWFGNQIYKKQLQLGVCEEDANLCHVEVSLGGQYSVCIAPPKTRIVDITKRYRGREIVITKYRADDYDIKRYKVAVWAASLCNLGYDWLGVVRFKLSFLFHWLNKFFCSEGSLWALQKEYPMAIGKKPEDSYPAAFIDRRDFEVVWKGIVTETEE